MLNSKLPMQHSPVPLRERAAVKRQSSTKKFFSRLGYTLFLSLFALGGTIWGRISSSPVLTALIDGSKKPAEEVFGSDSVNLLLLGCDEDLAPGGKKVLKAAGRADMILLAHLDFKAKTITGISVPRDTRVRLKGWPDHKINAYHNLAKPAEANSVQQQAVEALTGVKVDKTIVIDYTAFQTLVDTIGGVDVMIKDTMKYTDKAGGLFVDFVPGRKLLDGYDAMCYVRFRKDSGGDFKRTERQRQFLIAFKQSIIKNFTSLPVIAEQGVKVLGDTLTVREIASLAVFAKGVDQKKILMTRLPTVNGRGSFEELDKKPAKAMLRKYGFFNE
jgi:polyisoprenyl-teichoic acid--peptidoglycan teichoic acid transferase